MNAERLEELKKLLSDIGTKTGAVVRLAPSQAPETEFPLEYGGEKLVAYLEGTGEETLKTARLVQYFLGGEGRSVQGKDEALKSILLGEGSGWYSYRFMTKYAVPDSPCYAMELSVERRIAEALQHMQSCLAESPDLAVRLDDARIAIVKFSEEGPTPVEFGQFLVQSLYEELGVKANLGIGCEVRSFPEIGRSYLQASTAMRMSGLLKSKGEVHTYREYLLVKMLEDIPSERLKEYLEQFRVSGMDEIFADEEMIGTAEEFLESSLNISETSRNLYMHRNTLMYRLDKIERLTGLNIRKFSDAVTFRILTILHKLIH